MSDKSTHDKVSIELIARFKTAVHADERQGYEGLVVSATALIEVVTYLKNELGFDYLTVR